MNFISLSGQQSGSKNSDTVIIIITIIIIIIITIMIIIIICYYLLFSYLVTMPKIGSRWLWVKKRQTEWHQSKRRIITG